jgi:ATP-dependent RNA helicase RhlE
MSTLFCIFVRQNTAKLTFKEFHFDIQLQDSLDSIGFENPTPIQEQAIPIIQNGKDLIACAQTGTGKTAAFLLPILNFLSKKPAETTCALIIVPTRELALQIDQALEGFSYFTGVSHLAIYGGSDGQVFAREKKALVEGANIIIATPGRLTAHLNMGYVKFNDLNFLVLDEADRMLDMGFVEDILKIVTFLPEQRQTLMFSATMPDKIRVLAKKLLKSPEEISLAVSKPAEGVTQQAYLVYDTQKNKLMSHLLKDSPYKSVIVFASTKLKVKELEKDLRRFQFKVSAIHSDLDQPEREEALRKFRNKHIQILVATDILSRGIDIESIDLVVNFDVPHDPEDYIHRIGRTARAESKGMAITLINDFKQYKFSNIEKMIGYEIEKMPLPDFLGEGPKYLPDAKVKDTSNFAKKKPFKRKPFNPNSNQ